MNGATLKTVREALCLSAPWFAELCEVDESTLLAWESGNMQVPEVAAIQIGLLESMAADMAAQVVDWIGENIAGSGLPECPVRLVVYADAEAMARFQPEMPKLPVSFHAGIVARVRWAMQPLGVEIEAHTLNVASYDAWLQATQQEDSQALRAQYVMLDDCEYPN